jgi:hypothetical protein
VLTPTGAVSNPNDNACISLSGLGFAAGLYSTMKRSAALPRLLCFTAIVASLYGSVASDSRSAIVGVLCGAIYHITRRRISISPASVFASPFLFTLIGLALLPEMPTKAPRSS